MNAPEYDTGFTVKGFSQKHHKPGKLQLDFHMTTDFGTSGLASALIALAKNIEMGIYQPGSQWQRRRQRVLRKRGDQEIT